MNNIIDKIVLFHGKDRCTVYLVNGASLHFNFFKLGMTYVDGLKWIEEEVLNCVNMWKRDEDEDEVTHVIEKKAA